jgi:hypothetical protein
MFGNSIPAGTLGGDLFQYTNLRQQYDIDARIRSALKRAKDSEDGTFKAGRYMQLYILWE